MNRAHHILVIDPIAFAGGSKVATRNMLDLDDKRNTRVTVVTSDPDFWRDDWIEISPLYEPGFLACKDRGILYFLRHLVIVASVFYARVRHGKIDLALGASGPGIDLSLYLAGKILSFKIIQLIHGPVAKSRTIARALLAADIVFYLESTRESLVNTLTTQHSRVRALQLLNETWFKPFANGLPQDQWPAACNTDEPVIFWAASLLKWKGLETLLSALLSIPAALRPVSHICYIRPQASNLATSKAPVEIENVTWHESPGNLDSIRSQCSIFVSTSQQEPFGLSILEAMAAGHCVLIPADGAYWDQTLADGVSCIKYTAGDASDLANKLFSLSRDTARIRRLGEAASDIARNYRAKTQYAAIRKLLKSEKEITGAVSAGQDQTPQTDSGITS